MSTILVVDDEKNIVSGLKATFELENYRVITAENGLEAWNAVNSNDVDLVITDLRMPVMTGDELVRRISAAYPRLPVIVLTGHGTIENAVDSMRDGAVDFYTKPVDIDKLLLVVKKCLENSSLAEQNRVLTEEIEKLRSEQKYSRIIGRSEKVEKLMDIIRAVAPTKTTVLIEGESGTGKELVADAIMELSQRRDKPFVKVNCASLSSSLLENELFGHEKGAFTGAVKEAKGRFELASGGTIFLDEIGEIDEQTQIKLLRVLENREITRIGGEKPIEVDVRVIAATNKDLKKLVEEGKFREDFYFRLNVVCITVPPLRERKEDIELLALSFVKSFAEENGKKIDGISAAARNALFSYSWPGNIRELKNAIESAVVFARGRTIELYNLPQYITESRGQKETSVTITLPTTLADAEKDVILGTLDYCNGNKSTASKVLGIGRKTLHRRLREWNVVSDEDEDERDGEDDK